MGAECPSFTIRWMRFCCPHVDNAPCPLFSPGYGMQCVLLGRNEITKKKKNNHPTQHRNRGMALLAFWVTAPGTKHPEQAPEQQ